MVIRYAGGMAQITTSRLLIVGNHSRRTTSRNRRFSWFRRTAVCPYFGTTTPTRRKAKGEELMRRTRPLAFRVLPSFRIRSMSWRRVTRAARGYINGSRPGVLRRQLHGETRATLLATATQHRTPPTGGHAGPKAMCTNPTLVARAIGWFTHSKNLGRTIDLRFGKRRGKIMPLIVDCQPLSSCSHSRQLTYQHVGPTLPPP